jgi:hypothetical protein
LLDRFGIRMLGDLHGRKVVDFAWEKNCGPKTLYELDLLTRRTRFQNGKASRSRDRRTTRASRMLSRGSNGEASERVVATTQEDGASFAIPESIYDLPFHELPVTRRLGNVVRSIGARRLGDLNGRNAFELLQYKSCGWRTISEIQQLIERAVSGEFDVGQIEENAAAAELVSLLEQALAKLPLRDKQFLRARIGAETGGGRSLRKALQCPSYAEIGRRYGLTRARVQKVFANILDTLRRTWGPRIPRLLEIIKWRCLSTSCPLTPHLLGKWVNSPSAFSSEPPMPDSPISFRLSMEAQVRLIAALDKSIPCWPEANHKPRRINGSVSKFDLALARVVREAGGHMSVAEAYRKLSQAGQRENRRLTIQNFLSMLPSVESSVIEFKNPEIPIIRLRPSNADVFLGGISTQNGKPSIARKIPSNSTAIQLFGSRIANWERQAVAKR